MVRRIFTRLRKLITNTAYSELLFLAALVLIATLSHRAWFIPGNILSEGDFQFHYIEQVRNMFVNGGTWLSSENLGAPNIQLYFYPLRTLVWSTLALIGLPFYVSVKLTHLIPIALLGFLSPYYLSRKISSNTYIAFVVALFYGSITHFLVRQQMHLAIAFITAIAPLILLAFMKALENNRTRNWALFGALYWLGTVYELRIMYIITGVLLLYFIINFGSQWKKYIKPALVTGAILIGMSAFWVLPTIMGSTSDAIEATADRPLFGDPLYSLSQAFTIFEHSWTGLEPSIFNPQPVPLYFWAIPILALCSLLTLATNRTRKQKYLITFFAILSLIGIILTKQSAEPWPSLFTNLREYIPGFVLFRSASKFYVVTSLGYLGLLSFTLLQLRKYKLLFGVTSGLIIVLALVNLKPLFTQNLGMLTTKKNIHAEYQQLKSEQTKNTERENTLWLPRTSRWAYQDYINGRVSAVSILQNKWKRLDQQSAQNNKGAGMMEFLTLSYADKLLDFSGINRVAVPIQDAHNEGELFTPYDYDRDKYIEDLDEINYLSKNHGYNDLTVYNNSDTLPFINATSQIYTSDNFDNLNSQQYFVNQVYGDDYNFSEKDQLTTTTPLSVQSVFSEYETKQDPFVVNDLNINMAPTSKLYKNTTAGFLSYETIDNELVFAVTPLKNIYINNQEAMFAMDSKKNIIARAPKSQRDNLLIQLNEDVAPLASVDSQILGSTAKLDSLKVLEKGANILNNGSFEQGLWQDEVGDCRNYDSDPVLNMDLSNTASHGNTSLLLSAKRHTACTQTTFDVLPGEYMFSFDYSGSETEEAGYFLQFDDNHSGVLSERLPITVTSGWQTTVRKVLVPEGVSKATLYVYAYEPDEGPAASRIRYDNFQMYQPNKVEEVKFSQNTSSYKTLELNSYSDTSKLAFEYRDKQFSGSNVITNGSFEQGLWEKEVGDCHNYDSEPVLKMEHSSNESVDGNHSLKLSATRHTACTFTRVNFGSVGPHILKFSHKLAGAADSVGFHLRFNDPARTVVSERMPVENNNDWQQVIRKLRVPLGSNSARLHLYAYQSDGVKENIVHYDDLSLTAIPDLSDAYFVVNENRSAYATPRSIDFETVNSAMHKIRVRGGSKKFILTMAENYQPDWKVYLSPHERSAKCSAVKKFNLKETFISECLSEVKVDVGKELNFASEESLFDENHFRINGYANAWVVDPGYIKKHFPKKYWMENSDSTLDFNLIIYYKPQSYFYIGGMISGVTFFGAVGYIGWDLRSKRSKRRSALSNNTGVLNTALPAHKAKIVERNKSKDYEQAS